MVLRTDFLVSFNQLFIHEVRIKRRQAAEDNLGSLEQVVGEEDKPDLDQGSLGVPADGGSLGEVVEGTPDVDDIGSTVAEGNPVIGEVSDICRDCNPLAWVCRSGRAWA